MSRPHPLLSRPHPLLSRPHPLTSRPHPLTRKSVWWLVVSLVSLASLYHNDNQRTQYVIWNSWRGGFGYAPYIYKITFWYSVTAWVKGSKFSCEVGKQLAQPLLKKLTNSLGGNSLAQRKPMRKPALNTNLQSMYAPSLGIPWERGTPSVWRVLSLLPPSPGWDLVAQVRRRPLQDLYLHHWPSQKFHSAVPAAAASSWVRHLHGICLCRIK